MELIRWILAVAHVLAGAAWFGAMLYSLMVLHPRARSFFVNVRQLEEFISYLAAGARWKVLSGIAFIGLTGAGLIFCSPAGQPSSAQWVILTVKMVLFAAAMGASIGLGVVSSYL